MESVNLNGTTPGVRVGFVLTREGRAWTEEALAHLTGTVEEKFPSEPGAAGSGILWQAGIQLNDPGLLASLLRKRPDAFVVLSLPEKSAILNSALDTEMAMAEYLENNADSGATSWSLLASMYAAKDGGQA